MNDSFSYDAELYELLHSGTPGDLAFYRKWCRGADNVLELGCGYGRVLCALSPRFRPASGGWCREWEAFLTKWPPGSSACSSSFAWGSCSCA